MTLEVIGTVVWRTGMDSMREALEILGYGLRDLSVSFPVGINITGVQMRAFGHYVSEPRSASESPRPFAEPGLFVINAEGTLQVTDISNGPFVRPDLETLVGGLEFIRNPENNYPIRGTIV